MAYVPDAGHATLIDLFSADPDVSSNVLTTEEEGIAPHHTSAPRDPARFAGFCAEMVRRYVGSGPVKPIPTL